MIQAEVRYVPYLDSAVEESTAFIPVRFTYEYEYEYSSNLHVPVSHGTVPGTGTFVLVLDVIREDPDELILITSSVCVDSEVRCRAISKQAFKKWRGIEVIRDCWEKR